MEKTLKPLRLVEHSGGALPVLSRVPRWDVLEAAAASHLTLTLSTRVERKQEERDISAVIATCSDRQIPSPCPVTSMV